jgi:hypothetical protein
MHRQSTPLPDAEHAAVALTRRQIVDIAHSLLAEDRCRQAAAGRSDAGRTLFLT